MDEKPEIPAPMLSSVDDANDYFEAAYEAYGQFGGALKRILQAANDNHWERLNRRVASMWTNLTYKQKETILAAYVARRLEQ